MTETSANVDGLRTFVRGGDTIRTTVGETYLSVLAQAEVVAAGCAARPAEC